MAASILCESQEICPAIYQLNIQTTSSYNSELFNNGHFFFSNKFWSVANAIIQQYIALSAWAKEHPPTKHRTKKMLFVRYSSSYSSDASAFVSLPPPFTAVVATISSPSIAKGKNRISIHQRRTRIQQTITMAREHFSRENYIIGNGNSNCKCNL